MSKNNVTTAVAFYTALGEKNIATMEKYLHPEVRFIGPLAQTTGKEVYLEAARNFSNFFKKLTIRAQFGSGDQAMLAYDFECPPPIGHFPAAVLLTFQEGLISQIELFYDARPFERKKNEIFS